MCASGLKARWFRLINLAMRLIIHLCLIMNIVFVTSLYMRFETQTNEGFYTSVQPKRTQFSLCFNINSLLTKTKDISVQKLFYIEYVNRTMGDIFSALPHPSQILAGCSYRDFERDIIINPPDPEECNKVLRVTRYRMQSYICYTFHLDYDDKKYYSFHQVSLSQDSPKILASLTIKSPLSDGHSIYTLVHHYEFTVEDRIFNPELFPSSTQKQLFKVAYDRFEVVRLPPPYDTMCAVNSSKVFCYLSCMNEIYSQNGYFLVEGYSDDSNESHRLDVPPYHDPAHSGRLKKLYISSRALCTGKCNRESCVDILYRTYTSQPYPNEAKMTFDLEILKHPITRVVYQIKYSFMTYITEVLALLSIWINVSIWTVLSSRSAGRFEPLSQAVVLEIESQKIIRRARIVAQPRRGIRFTRIWRTWKLIGKIVKKILSMFFIPCCLTLLSVQVFQLVSIYFMYQTETAMTQIFNPEINHPRLTLCLDVQYFFKQPTLRSLKPQTYARDYLKYDVLANHTLSELFDSVAGVSLLSGCSVRNWTELDLRMTRHLSPQECMQRFSISVFYLDGNMCFLFASLETEYQRFFASDLRLSTSDLPGVMYILEIKKEIKKVIKMDVMLDVNPLPYKARKLSAVVGLTSLRTIYFASNSVKSTFLLPPPYDTMCHNYGTLKPCRVTCLEKALASTFDRMPLREINLYNSSMKVISFSDIYDANNYKKWIEIGKICQKKCSKRPCQFKLSKTHLKKSVGGQYDLAFFVDLPSMPESIIAYQAKITMYNLLFNLMCSISFWTGFSFVSLLSINATDFHLRVIKRIHTRSLKSIKFIERILTQERSVISHMKEYFNRMCYVYDARCKLTFIICSVGCIIHLMWIQASYFRYPTIISTSLHLEDQSNFSLSICLYPPHSVTDDNLIQECSVRGLEEPDAHVSDKFFFTLKNTTQCNERFNVRPFTAGDDICFQFTPRGKEISIDNNFNSPPIMYAITMNTTVLSETYRVSITNGDTLPSISINWSPVLERIPRGRQRMLLRYVKYRKLTVPYPYDDNGMASAASSKCIGSCVGKEPKLLSRVESNGKDTALQIGNQLQPTMSPENKTVASVFAACEARCRIARLSCPEPPCEYLYTATEAITGTANQTIVPATTEFLVYTSDSLVSRMQFSPAITLIDLLITAGSVLGIWFGMSVASFNPSSQLSSNHHDIMSVRKRLLDVEKHIERRERVLAARKNGKLRCPWATPKPKIEMIAPNSRLGHLYGAACSYVTSSCD